MRTDRLIIASTPRQSLKGDPDLASTLLSIQPENSKLQNEPENPNLTALNSTSDAKKISTEPKEPRVPVTPESLLTFDFCFLTFDLPLSPAAKIRVLS
jgi:hypothetical protein